MMVTYVRGHFKNIRGTLEFDPLNPRQSSVEVTIEAKTLWSDESQRDDHLRSVDFLDVANHPTITFKGSDVELIGDLKPTEILLTQVMGFKPIGVENGWRRYGVDGGTSGKIIELRELPQEHRGQWGAGGVHHVAWRMKDSTEEMDLRDSIAQQVYGRRSRSTASGSNRFISKNPAARSLSWQPMAPALRATKN